MTMTATELRAAEAEIRRCYRNARGHDASAHEWRKRGEAAIEATRALLTERRQAELSGLSMQRINQIRAGRESARSTGVKHTQNGKS